MLLQWSFSKLFSYTGMTSLSRLQFLSSRYDILYLGHFTYGKLRVCACVRSIYKIKNIVSLYLLLFFFYFLIMVALKKCWLAEPAKGGSSEVLSFAPLCRAYCYSYARCN